VNKNPPDATVCRYLYSLQNYFAVNKYLHTVAFVGFLFTLNYDARNHELKIFDAKKARDIYHYKNIKRKLYRINAATWYNKT